MQKERALNYVRYFTVFISLKIKVQFRLLSFKVVYKLLIYNKIVGNLYKVTSGYQVNQEII
ncbi:hypothetical protein B9T27_03205 [Acinetobacter sp. ANC 4648]|nr:hypothetical protein B9T27_03205 [Acinetobacter sp. ANC 4648]